MTSTSILGTIYLFIALMPVNQFASLPLSGNFLPETEIAKTIELVKPPVDKHGDIEGFVHASYEDIPLLIEIAKCESRIRHFDEGERVFRGVNTADVGVMQINEFYHLKRSQKLGFNIYTPEGNVAYARFLYEKEGTKPWKASEKCWKKFEHLAKK